MVTWGIMYHESAVVHTRSQVASNVHTLSFRSERIAHSVRPGQFLNIKPDASYDPLLRRAYSVHRVREDTIEIIFNVVGKGSAILACKAPGDSLDVLGPLGAPFNTEGSFSRAILVSGGVGIAPMPILGEHLVSRGVDVVTIHGARSRNLIADDDRLVNPLFATDDGSKGFHGTVVEALDTYITKTSPRDLRLFACGPNRMLAAVGTYADTRGLALEVSLECQMACGIGICQGCPVEMRSGDRRYSLVCTHGPNYNINDIVLESIPDPH